MAVIKKSKKVNKLSMFFKHLFFYSIFANKNNNHTPHVFHNFGLLTLLLVCTFLLGASVGSSYFFKKTILGASIASNVIVDLTNQDRLSMNIPPLRVNQLLMNAAKLKTDHMIANNYFAHNSPDGVTPWYFIQLVGYDFLYAGENLAINFNQAQDVEVAWMNSPLHRENLLNVKFEEVGVAATRGLKDGQETIFIVQMFGTPAHQLVINTEEQEKLETVQKVKKKEHQKVLYEDKVNTIAVNNQATTTNNLTTHTGQVAGVEKYSSWWERKLFELPYYVEIIFYIVIFLLFSALLLLLVVEYHKHHYRHFYVGMALICLLLIFIAINSFLLG